jgi:hypothetical protein
MRFAAFSLTLGLCVASVAATALAGSAKPPAKGGAVGAKYDEARLKELEAKLTRTPKDAKLKTEVAEANYHVGHAMMVNDSLPPRVKYRGALKHFNRALALNPKHPQAAEEKKMIVDIYRQMGRPVPQ